MKDHWEKVYATKDDLEVSWYQENPATSLKLICSYANLSGASIIDVGGGNSNLVIELIKKGFTNVSVLDISENAIGRTRSKMQMDAEKVTWQVSDVLDFESSNKFDLWHDRAVFHFLAKKEEVAKYVGLVSNKLNPKGVFVLATFSEKGPLKCSGLEVQQYTIEDQKLLFNESFELDEYFEEEHTTPFNTKQNFLYSIWRRKI